MGDNPQESPENMYRIIPDLYHQTCEWRNAPSILKSLGFFMIYWSFGIFGMVLES